MITSKDKLEVLTNCQDPFWKDTFRPSFDCGISGNGSGYRHDTLTTDIVLTTLAQEQPTLLLVNFQSPDTEGHTGDWNLYLQALRRSDSLVSVIWHALQEKSY